MKKERVVWIRKLAQIREYSDIGKVTKEIYHQFRDLYGQAQAIDLDRIIDAQDEVLYRNMQSSQMGYEPVYNAFVEFYNVIRNTATEIMNSGVLPADKPKEEPLSGINLWKKCVHQIKLNLLQTAH